ncbi:MFS transporter, partial [archaeon]
MLSRVNRLRLPCKRLVSQFAEQSATQRLTASHFASNLTAISVRKSHFSTNTPSQPSGDGNTPPKKLGLLDRLFGEESNVASENFKSRWSMIVPAAAIHLCIGSPYAWSLMADTITKEAGFVLSAASDWSLMEAAFPLSIVFVAHGLSGSIFGKWQLKVGTRKSMAAAACAFGSSLLFAAAGIHFHSLPLLYVGYGILGGTGIGLAYTPPVQTLMQWFPEKKGVASGLTLAGFGSGALIFTLCAQALMKHFAKLPEYLGPAKSFTTQVIEGKLFA